MPDTNVITFPRTPQRLPTDESAEVLLIKMQALRDAMRTLQIELESVRSRLQPPAG